MQQETAVKESKAGAAFFPSQNGNGLSGERLLLDTESF